MKEIVTKFDGASTYSADEFNPNMSELENAVVTSGQSLNEVNLNQLGEAMARYSSGGGFVYNEGGAGNAFVLTSPLTFIQPKSYFNGMLIMCTAGFSITGPSTINVSTIGVVNLTDSAGNPTVKDYLRVGDTFLAQYNLANLQFRILMNSRVVPYSSIMIFSGAVADIPPGWQLCDGTLGTPDLRDKFVQGAGGAVNPGDNGGSLVTSPHVLTIAEMPAHNHAGDFLGNASSPLQGIPPSANIVNVPGTTDSAGGGLGHSHGSIPPFYALAYIMSI